MKTKLLYSFLFCSSLMAALLSCGSDDDDKKSCTTFSTADSVCYCSSHSEDIACKKCETYSKADSVCFCTNNPDDANCVTYTRFTLYRYTEELLTLTASPVNSSKWTKGFEIDKVLYMIDRESETPQAFWKFDIDKNGKWEKVADFPGIDYGLTGSVNGKGYASSFELKKFWEYDPTANKWTPMGDLPFAPIETHWVEYKGKCYVPITTGIYEFDPDTKVWTKYSDQTSPGYGSCFVIGDDLYWYYSGTHRMSRFNFVDKTYSEYDLLVVFGQKSGFSCPFVLGHTAYIVVGTSLWTLNNQTHSWTEREYASKGGNAFPEEVFAIGNEAYTIEDEILQIFIGKTE